MPADPVDIRADVLSLLQDFSGIEPLKKLFWTTLNYNRANKSLTRRGWADGTAALLHEDPLLLASGGRDDDFSVVYSRLSENRLLLGGERPVVSRLLKDHPYSLFIFSDKSQTNWHFVNVKMAEDQEKRKLFRRLSVGPNEKVRTASEVLSKLDLPSIGPDLFGLSPLKIQERHDEAFDVEPVTEEFFAQYRSTFEYVEGVIRGIRDKNRKRSFTQRLFNRLMFVAFIQKKGWLQFGNDKNQDYLNALWSDYKRNGNKEMGFYYERLYNLFFHGLGAQDDIGISKINRGGVFKDFIGKVPYMNGGLFEEDEDDKDSDIRIPDDAIKSILHGLFNHFNFTVTEATPLDIEVAVDPEMLGKVFEELVTGRHETGSYYTPKAIVSFMCREALKGHLETHLPKEKREGIQKFVDDHDPNALRDAEAVLEALRHVRVCDPACGSGAYLLGMLHELMDLRTCLFSSRNLDPLSAYDRKLDIIERNIYGVDNDPFAVNIARLRLWLSLSVEFEGHEPPPLPNLKFEIEQGDSLVLPPHEIQSSLRDADIAHYAMLKGRYIKAHGPEKSKVEKEVISLRTSIASWMQHERDEDVFDWQVQFAEVFLDGGFDIVVANPPYVSALECSRVYSESYRNHLKSTYRSARGAYDLFVPFFELGLACLRQNGFLAFITPNKYLSAKYATELRAVFIQDTAISHIVDVSTIKVFKKASVYPVLTFLRKAPQNGRLVKAIIPNSREVETFDLADFQTAEFPKESLTALPENIWGFLLSPSTSLLAKIMRGSVQLSSVGEVAATSTASEADEYGQHLSNTRAAGSLKVVNTGTIDPYVLLWGQHQMTNAGSRYLTPWLSLSRAGVNSRRQEMYRSPKLIFAKMARACEAALDVNGEYASLNTNCFFKPTNGLTLEYVTAFCNSKVFMFIYQQFFGALRMSGGYFQFQAPQLRVIPIRVISAAE